MPSRLLYCSNPHPAMSVHDNETKQSDDDIPVMKELWGMRSTRSLLSLPGPVWPGVASPDRVIYMGWIELNRGLSLLFLQWYIREFVIDELFEFYGWVGDYG